MLFFVRFLFFLILFGTAINVYGKEKVPWPPEIFKNYRESQSLSDYIQKTKGMESNFFGQHLLQRARNLKTKPRMIFNRNQQKIIFSSQGVQVVIKHIGNDRFEINNQLFVANFLQSPKNFLKSIERVLPKKQSYFSPFWGTAEAFVPIPVGLAIAAGATVVATAAYWRSWSLTNGIKKCRKLTLKIDRLIASKKKEKHSQNQSFLALSNEVQSLDILSQDTFLNGDSLLRKKKENLSSCARHAQRLIKQAGYGVDSPKVAPINSER